MFALPFNFPFRKKDGSLTTIDDAISGGGGGGGYVLPTATANRLGGIKVGDNLTVQEDGTLSASGGGYTLPTATASRLGGVKIGSNISVGEDGTISTHAPYSLPNAGASTLGGVKVGSGLSIDENGVLSASGGGGGGGKYFHCWVGYSTVVNVKYNIIGIGNGSTTTMGNLGTILKKLAELGGYSYGYRYPANGVYGSDNKQFYAVSMSDAGNSNVKLYLTDGTSVDLPVNTLTTGYHYEVSL